MAGADEPRLDKARHIKYWTRCLKTLLPHHYTGNESNRMYLAFFIISALDLLGALNTVTNETERADYVNWIYRCQHPSGGFRMWPGTDFGPLANGENARWDPAHMPGTYFALCSLLIIGDDLQRVNRRATLEWIRTMQRPDGSFGETLVDGRIEGGNDPRFGYCAAGVRHILRGNSTIQDIDVDSLVRCVKIAESYDGGIADLPFREPHAGYTYCSLGCLKFLDRLHTLQSLPTEISTAPTEPASTLAWLAARQTDLSDPDAELDDSTGEVDGVVDSSNDQSTPPLHQSPDKSMVVSPFGIGPLEAGMNGRTNKVADTCYAWWAGASCHMLESPNIYNSGLLYRYLLDKTQHPALGGFGKYPDYLPDLYHSYLGLATLALSPIEGLKEIDATMCISKEASSRIPTLWKEEDK